MSETSKPSHFSDTLLIAAIPLIGFAYAFAYEYGYLTYFGVPYWTIHVTLPHALGITALFIALWLTTGFILNLLPKGPWFGVIWHGWNIMLGVLAFRIATAYIDWTSPASVFIAVTFGGFLGLLTLVEFLKRFVAPLINNSGTWLERWNEEAQKDIRTERTDAHFALLTTLEEKGVPVSKWLFPMWVSLVALPAICYGAGAYAARHQAWFLVAERDAPCVLLRRYGDVTLCAGYNRPSATLNGRVVLLPSGSEITARRQALRPRRP
jgi:hypothetical protein